MRLTAISALLALAVHSASAASANTPAAPVASRTEIAVYVPPSDLSARTYSVVSNLWIEPGKAFSDALHQVAPAYFGNWHLLPSAKPVNYGLLLDLEPEWKSAGGGKMMLKLKYDVLAADGKKLHSAVAERLVPFKAGNFNGPALAAAQSALQEVMLDTNRRFGGDPAQYPATASSAKLDPLLLVSHEKPIRTGTAFFINKQGQLLTAAHVARDCTLLEAHQDGVTFPVSARASSDLLDVAVLDSGKPRTAALPMRQGNQIMLGENVTSVGFPLKGLLGDSPNITRGNISSSKGIRGSMGLFQFSAPIQPGNSGGPVVSDNGELLGMAVSTLNAQSLAKDGLIPQNVNFALDGRHVASFLRREQVVFDSVKPEGEGGMQQANQAALSNTVQLSCYQ